MKNQIILTCIVILLSLYSSSGNAQQFEPALPPVPIVTDEQIKQTPEVGNVKKTVAQVSNFLSSTTIRYSTSALINIRHPWTPTEDNVYVLHAGYTWSKIERRLFADDNMRDIEALYIDANPDNAVSFHVDPYWQRIVYSKKSGNWIRSYGDAPDQTQLVGPRAIAVDISDTIYVANTEGNNIVKLWFDRNDNGGKLKFLTSFSVSGMSHPIDIAINQSGSLSNPPNPANDRIWIADDYGRKLIEINRRGAVTRQITNCDPFKVQTQEIGGRLAYIDRVQNAFIMKSLSSLGTIASTYFNPTSSSLSCIGQDINNEWWVGDEKMKMYHHFTSSGDYLASYSSGSTQSGSFQSPVTVSKAPFYLSGETIYRSQYLFTSDRWGSTTGLRAFFPGADAVNLTFIDSYTACQSGISFVLTNRSLVKGTLRKHDDTEIIATYDYGDLQAGDQIVCIDKLKMGNEQYDFTIELLPYYWSSYDIGAEVWTQRVVTFVSSPYTAWAASIHPVPSSSDCFPSGTQGHWKVTTYCSGFFTYKWFKNSATGNDNWVEIGTNNDEVSLWVGPQDFELRCDVTNNVVGGSTQSFYYRNCPTPPPSCPFVYTWDGTKFSEDNNILPQSEYRKNKGIDVTDYYRLLKPLKEDEGSYVLQIREFEHEQSFFDQFRLLAVDHPRATKIDVSENGEIYQYVTPYRLSRAFIRETEILPALIDFDSITVEVNSGDTLHLSLSRLINKNSRFIQSIAGGGEAAGSGLPKAEKMAYLSLPPISIRSESPGLTFRQRPTLVFKPMSLSNLQSWDLVWTKKARLDYLNFGIMVSPTYRTYELLLSSAMHSRLGVVTSNLSKQDSTYATLAPSESIELRFNASAPLPQTHKRSFILVSTGRYIHLSDSISSQHQTSSIFYKDMESYSIEPNYPNPFNPQTEIRYRIREKGYVSIKIYNMQGTEVAILADGVKEAGVYSAVWDVPQSGISSGVYLCRFIVQATDGKLLYSEVRKMILVK